MNDLHCCVVLCEQPLRVCVCVPVQVLPSLKADGKHNTLWCKIWAA